MARPTRKTGLRVAPSKTAGGTLTLAIDIGGTGLKALILGPDGEPRTERVRVETPHPPTPQRVLRAIFALIEPLGDFDRVSVGFPGVVIDGVTKTAPNLHDAWRGFDLAHALAEKTRRPVRVLNDAGVQGFGVIEGLGVEMVLTLGTGLGCALFVNGHYVPNLELAHHPFRKNKTYEELLSLHAMKKDGKKKWNKHLKAALDLIEPIFNPRQIYLGGGNAKHIQIELPPHVKVTENVAGLLGGIALWQDQDRVDGARSVVANGAPVHRA